MKNIIDLLPDYFSILQKEKENSERYKWEAIQHFQEHWDITVPDDEFYEMFKSSFSKKENLIFQNSFGFLNELAKAMPNEAKKLLSYLFQDEISLEERLPGYQEKAKNLLPELKKRIGKENFQHQQDERTISFLLTLHRPDKYYLYKDNVYQAYCKFLGIVPKKAGEKFFHFSDLGEQAKTLLVANTDIKSSVQVADIRDTFSFDSNNLLFQDIVYRTLIVAHQNELDKEIMSQIVEDIKAKLFERAHELINHTWVDNDATNFRQVSVFVGEPAYPLHYEIMRHKDIAWEFHPEGNREQKEFMEPFIQGYDKSKYKLVQWKYAVTGPYKSGEFYKISPRKRFKVELKGANYDQMIELLTNQFIELYNDTNDRLINYLKNDSTISKEIAKIPTNMKQFPLNQILYGPPGTGKTYSTIERVVKICEPKEYEEGDYVKNKTTYERLVTEGRVFFTTFHQSMSYEDFIEGIKPVSPKKETDSLQYKVEDGIFKSMCEQCLDEIKDLKTQQITTVAELSFREKYNEFVRQIQAGLVQVETRSGLPVRISKVSASGNMRLITGDDTRDYIISANRLERLIEEIPEPDQVSNVHEAVRKAIGGSHSSLYFAALMAFKSFDSKYSKSIAEEGKHIEIEDVQLTKEEVENLPKYAIVIDEINRGNVSAIFGELITLIEEDKRFGYANQMSVKLPYSKNDFVVPPNLYIIGTMNTADRSVEALDTALRRRFSFEEMMPKPELLKDRGENNSGKIGGVDLCELVTVINQRIEVLVDRDHTIGHAFFMDNENLKDLRNTFANKIIPLLQEYFYGNYSKMEMVIGSAFFDVHDVSKVKFAAPSDEFSAEGKVYQIKNISHPANLTDDEFVAALNQLIKGQS